MLVVWREPHPLKFPRAELLSRLHPSFLDVFPRRTTLLSPTIRRSTDLRPRNESYEWSFTTSIPPTRSSSLLLEANPFSHHRGTRPAPPSPANSSHYAAPRASPPPRTSARLQHPPSHRSPPSAAPFRSTPRTRQTHPFTVSTSRRVASRSASGGRHAPCALGSPRHPRHC